MSFRIADPVPPELWLKTPAAREKSALCSLGISSGAMTEKAAPVQPEHLTSACCNMRLCLPRPLFTSKPCLHCSCFLPPCLNCKDCACPTCPCPKCSIPCPCPTGGCRCVFPHPSCGFRCTMPMCGCCCCFPCLKMEDEEHRWWLTLGERKDDQQIWSLCGCCACIPCADKIPCIKKGAEGFGPMAEIRKLRREVDELKAAVQQRM